MLLHKQIIHEAWEITKTHKKKLFKYGFFPSFFTAILGVVFVSYQTVAFQHSEFFLNTEAPNTSVWEILLIVWEWVKAHGGLTTSIVFFSFFSILMYLFSPVLCEGALIHYITQAKTGKELKGGLQTGFSKFLILFEVSALLSPFHFITFISEGSFLIRNFGPGAVAFTLPILGIMLFLGIIVNFLFVFANQYIVLEDEDVVTSIKKSTQLVLGNIKESFFLWGILLIIIARIFINLFLILLVPLVFFLILNLFAKFSLFALGLWIGGIIGAAMIWAAAYLLAGFTIFTTALWTLAFIEFRKIEISSRVSFE